MLSPYSIGHQSSRRQSSSLRWRHSGLNYFRQSHRISHVYTFASAKESAFRSVLTLLLRYSQRVYLRLSSWWDQARSSLSALASTLLTARFSLLIWLSVSHKSSFRARLVLFQSRRPHAVLYQFCPPAPPYSAIFDRTIRRLLVLAASLTFKLTFLTARILPSFLHLAIIFAIWYFINA